MKKNLYFATLLTVVFVFATMAVASETIIIEGAGPSTKIVEKFCKEFGTLPVAEGTHLKCHLNQ